MLRILFFPTFDWLHERGWLSTGGTARDLAVVALVGLVYSLPVVAVINLVMFWQ
jgi:hypothetical protein